MLAIPVLLLQAATTAPAATPAVGRTATAASQPADLSSYAGKVKLDRDKASTLFQQDGASPAEPAPAAGPRPAAATGPAPKTASAADESRWRSLASSRRQALEAARADLAAAEQRYPMAAYGVLASAQRSSLLVPYQQRVARAQTALDSLPEECRRAPGCQPGWVR